MRSSIFLGMSDLLLAAFGLGPSAGALTHRSGRKPSGASKSYYGPRPAQINTRPKRIKPFNPGSRVVGVPYCVRPARPAITPARLKAWRQAAAKAEAEREAVALAEQLDKERRPRVRKRLAAKLEALS